LSHSTPLRDTTGFTLIEALVALSIVAVALTSIGSLIASSARGGRSIDNRLTRLETARAIMTALPAREMLVGGTLSGEVANHPWRLDVLPFALQDVSPPLASQWAPQTMVLTIKSPSGAAIEIDTVRLRRSDSK
jgi:general secretion pathway protein I